MEDEEMTLYCICRSPDISRFMIMCDNCEEWYHGDCIHISEQESRRIKYFYCKTCRRKDPFLKIRYRKSKTKHSKEIEKKEKKKKRMKLEKHDDLEKRRKCSEKNDMKEWDTVKAEVEDYTLTDKRKKSHEEFSEKKCISKPKSPVRNAKQELRENRVQDMKENPKSSHKKDFKPNINESRDVQEQRKPIPERCGECNNCLRHDDCGKCDVCCSSTASNKVESCCRRRQCLAKGALHISSANHEEKQRQSKNITENAVNVESKRVDIAAILSQKDFLDNNKQQRISSRHLQCFGPGCTLPARPNSKYCSEECGRRLASKRLMHIMPSRVHDWNSTPTVANEIGSRELERIRASMVQARSELQALEGKFHRLESIISRSKTFPICEASTDEEDTDESDQSVFCVVCGHPVALRSAIKHMDRCYIKIESQISFGSVYPTRIEGSERLFCDVYNRQQQTYCKRLQIICPEHAKDPKVQANEVCGCPLRNDFYSGEEPTKASQFCSKAKRKCNKHYKWESMYRASVDLQRIRQWLKIDEIFEEERRIRNAMVSRAGVIPLLLHQTTIHDPNCLDMRTKPPDVKRPAYRLVI